MLFLCATSVGGIAECAPLARLSIIPVCMRPLWKEFIDAFEIWDGLLVGGHWVAEMRNAVSAIAIGTSTSARQVIAAPFSFPENELASRLWILCCGPIACAADSRPVGHAGPRSD